MQQQQPQSTNRFGVAGDDIITLNDGFRRINNEGIQPFLSFIETQQREFFKAKDFVLLYDLIFKMCIQRDPYNHSEAMYQRYTAAIENYLNEKVLPALKTATQLYDIAFLKQWRQRWFNQQLVVTGLAKLFMYLDRFYTPNTNHVLSLREQGFTLYKLIVFDVFCEKARSCILNCIDKERQGEEVDRGLLRECVDVWVEIGYSLSNETRGPRLDIYKQHLEHQIIQHAGLHYSRHSAAWMEQDSASVYLTKVEKMLNNERTRVESYLHRSTAEPLIKQCHYQMLQVHQQALLRKKTGLFHMLLNDARDDLSRLYRLYKVNETGLEPIAQMFAEHISAAGKAIVDAAKPGAALQTQQSTSQDDEKKEDTTHSNINSSEDGKMEEKSSIVVTSTASTAADSNHSLVQSLIDLHAQYNDIVSVCFDKALVMQKALKRSFEDFINVDNRVSKLLAKFVNDALKKGSRVAVKHLESVLDNVVFLYGYIQEKDVFEREYQQYLANRLLMGHCESEHSEKSMIAKLKTESGYQWTNKLEGMFKDVQLSKDLMLQYKRLHAAELSSEAAMHQPQLEVSVCTTGFWPSSKVTPGQMAREVAEVCDSYKRFYLNQHSGHKLEWRFDLGQAEVTVDFAPQCRKALVVTSYQMMILLVFNRHKRVTFQLLLELTSIPKTEIANHLLSLCHPKVAVLLKKPNNKQLEDSHQFQLNAQYKNPLKKIHIPFLKISQTAVGDEDEAESKQIELQRRHQMDAAIVRIMKTRKTLRHNQLVTEVITQLQARFRPTPPLIKKRVEALIEQEYLKRDEQDRSLYIYLA